MKIWIWNAFASNNSGSYTIVGSFPSEEEAQRVAEELRVMMEAHTKWLGQAERIEPSPLEAFIRANDLTWTPGLGEGDEWPEHGGKEVPDAIAVGWQVVVHHDYTVTMPRAFGELFYARGGRVDTELDHAHHPTVAIFEMWIGWEERKKVDVAARVAALEEALGPVPVRKEFARRSRGQFGEADLTYAAVFEDLAEGFAAVEKCAREQGFTLRVKVLEAFEEEDPLRFLR